MMLEQRFQRVVVGLVAGVMFASLGPDFFTPANLVAQESAQPSDDQSQESAEKPSNTVADKSEKKKRSRAADFMRIRKGPDGRTVALETSITRYERVTEDGERITVDLIGVVHIGEKEYYEALNKRFKQYEGLLYELVAPEGTVIPKGGREEAAGLNPVAAMQKGMQSALGLEFQLEHIDYTKKNFIHADMTPTEFAESMEKNDESVGKYALRAIGQGMAMQSAGKGGGEFGMLMAMFSSNKEINMRRAFAKQMKDMDVGLAMFEGTDGSTIIDHRNSKCMKVLQSEIDAGKKNLAIFYGAGHLPDMEVRLLEDFQMKRGGQQWLKAWSLETPSEKE